MGFPKKITDLPQSGALKLSDVFVLVNQHDVTSQTTLGDIASMISGGSSTFTGNTSGTCINQIWAHSISGCSPVIIGPEVIIEGEITFNGNINLSPDTETDVDFDNANTVSIPTYVLKDCKGNENNIVTFQNFSEYVGQVVTLASEGGTRWEVTLQPTLEVTTIEECCFDNFKISNCDTGELWNIVNWEAWAGTGFIGTIIKIEDVEGCFSVTGTCEEWTYDAKVLVSNQYETCIECTTTPFTLIPCDGWEGEIIFTNTDLSAYVGGVIKELETGICYNVEDCVGPCEPTIPIIYEELAYIECGECKDNWQLTNCLGEVVGITTTQSELWEPGFAFSSSTTDGCFTVDKIKEPANVGELEDIIVVDCLSIECAGEPPITYKLSGCDGLTEFYTDTDLSEYVGSYIHAETLPPQGETCFYVTEELGESTYDVFEPQAIYTEEEGCDCCGQNPKWKYSACDDEEDQVVWENTALGPLGIYAPPSCVRMSIDDGETWKCYNFMLCVPEEEPTEGITNFEVLEDSECCEGELCAPSEVVSLEIDGETQPTSSNFGEAPYDDSDPGEGWGWVLITYSEEGILGQNINDVFSNGLFFEGNFPDGLTIFNSEAQMYWPAFELNAIGELIPGESYQININANSIITSGGAGLEGYFSFA